MAGNKFILQCKEPVMSLGKIFVSEWLLLYDNYIYSYQPLIHFKGGDQL